MNKQQYLEQKRRENLDFESVPRRQWCFGCYRPSKTCFCAQTKMFQTQTRYIFLMHPKEAKKQRTGTGRLTKSCLKNSEIIIGTSFDQNTQIQKIINNNSEQSLLLYPGSRAWNLNQDKRPQYYQLKENSKLNIFIIDGTWACAKSMIRESPTLLALNKVSFDVHAPSAFSIKHQPHASCLSTIESVHKLIENLSSLNIDPTNGQEKVLMDTFHHFVEFQLRCASDPSIPSSRGKKLNTSKQTVQSRRQKALIREKKGHLFYWDEQRSKLNNCPTKMELKKS